MSNGGSDHKTTANRTQGERLWARCTDWHAIASRYELYSILTRRANLQQIQPLSSFGREGFDLDVKLRLTATQGLNPLLICRIL
jgi:hypothetical protein